MQKNDEPQRYSWECRRMVNPRDTAGNAEEKRTPEIQLGKQKKYGRWGIPPRWCRSNHTRDFKIIL